MKTQLFLFFSSLLFYFNICSTFTAAHYHPTTADTIFSATPTAATATTNNKFIHASCKTTKYPELCYNNVMSSYANADPVQLATAAIKTNLDAAMSLATYLGKLSNQAQQPDVAAALKDCVSVFGDAVGQIRDSLNQMKQIRGPPKSARFQLNNVLTWMSAALTNEDTCIDGFESVPAAPVKTDVVGRVSKVEELSKNALKLVNNIA